MFFIEILKSIFFGIVEGITEWLPISSTGHLILAEEFISFDSQYVSKDFWSMFEVVVQLGAIIAVVVVFWKKIWPFSIKDGDVLGIIKYDKLMMWLKIAVACIPAIIIGLTIDDWIDEHLYNGVVVGIMLLVLGVAFILVENANKNKKAQVVSIDDLSFKNALEIGIFQCLAAILPGTSRSGATILGGLMLGIDRIVAAEFTFFLGIPVMFGASILKIFKFGLNFTLNEIIILLVGMLVAFAVSMVCIRFLMSFIKKHDFKVFGWYRIGLGILVLIYFIIKYSVA